MNQPDNFCQKTVVFCNAEKYDGLKNAQNKSNTINYYLITKGYNYFKMKILAGTAIA